MKKMFTEQTRTNVINNVKGLATETCKIAVPVLAALVLRKCNNDISSVSKNSIDYNDTIDAIMASTMYSETKREIIALIKPGCDSSFYSAVISVINSTMYSGTKLEMIKDMCNNLKS